MNDPTVMPVLGLIRNGGEPKNIRVIVPRTPGCRSGRV